MQHESNLEYTRHRWVSLSVFFVKVPPKSDFQSTTEEPKYQVKALTVVTDTIKKNWLTAGAAVVVTIPSVTLKVTRVAELEVEEVGAEFERTYNLA